MTQTTLFQNVRLIDGLADQPRDGVSILVTGERITEIEPGPRPVPTGAKLIDLKGKTVVPGLIDTHVHTTMLDDAYLPLFLAAGVTSARDVGGKLEKVLKLRADLESGKILGPRLLVYGPMLDGAVRSVDLPWFLESSDTVPSPEAVPQKIGDLLAAGVDGVKLYFSMPPETTKAAIQFVDKRVPVTGHLGYTHSIDAIEWGIDGLEHVWISPYNDFCALDMQYGPGTFMSGEWYEDTARGWAAADLKSVRARTWFDAMAEKQVGLGTTLTPMLWATKYGKEAVRNDPDRRYMTPQALAFAAEMEAELGGKGLPGDLEKGDPDWDTTMALFDPYAAPMPEVLDQLQQVTHTLHEAGGVVVGGTDTGALAYPPPGFILLREVEMLADSLGAMQAIQAVTSAAARHLRRENDIGAVAAGRYADFLVIDGDPLRDPRELRNLVTVYRGGTEYDPKALLAEVPQRDL